MIIILLTAAALSVITEGMDGLTDAMIILAVVVLNAAFGVYQEGQAEAAIEALKNMSSPLARVRRDGHVIEIDSKNWSQGISFFWKLEMWFLLICACWKQLLLRSKKQLLGESVPVEKM